MSTINDRRQLALEGAFNMRDLGHVSTEDGYEVRNGKLFRADALHKLTPADLELLGKLGIQAIIDLRSENEIASTGPARLTEQGARHIHKPIMGGDPARPDRDNMPESLGHLYTLMAKHGADRFVDTVETLATIENIPAVFHCAAGKDRTGITAALIYSILKVDRETIIADYVITDANMVRMRAQLMEGQPELANQTREYPESYMRAEDSTIRTFLRELDEEFGSPVEWLLKSGLQKSSIETLRRELLG